MPGKQLSMTERNSHPDAPLVRAQTAKREMVERHGTQDQKERYLSGDLPEDELLVLARSVLFAPLLPFRRYQKITLDKVRHVAAPCPPHDARFFTREVEGGFTANEWHDYRRIKDAMEEAWRAMPPGSHVRIEIVEHVGVCSVCQLNEAISRAASVRIAWAGHELVREYQLGGL